MDQAGKGGSHEKWLNVEVYYETKANVICQLIVLKYERRKRGISADSQDFSSGQCGRMNSHLPKQETTERVWWRGNEKFGVVQVNMPIKVANWKHD